MQHGNQVGEAIEVQVGGEGRAIVGAEAVVYDGGSCARVACCLHVHFGIADEQRVFAGNGKLRQYFIYAKRIGFFCWQTVAAVNYAKVSCQVQGFEDKPADVLRFVGEDGHGHLCQGLQCSRYAWINAGVNELVVVVVP